ncbi:hypothetical protein J6590_029948 [Homalodisca vitripennis]|nr:hypothetical protein J6590_029948 [Homalodisca vitripennis]
MFCGFKSVLTLGILARRMKCSKASQRQFLLHQSSFYHPQGMYLLDEMYSVIPQVRRIMKGGVTKKMCNLLLISNFLSALIGSQRQFFASKQFLSPPGNTCVMRLFSHSSGPSNNEGRCDEENVQPPFDFISKTILAASKQFLSSSRKYLLMRLFSHSSGPSNNEGRCDEENVQPPFDFQFPIRVDWISKTILAASKHHSSGPSNNEGRCDEENVQPPFDFQFPIRVEMVITTLFITDLSLNSSLSQEDAAPEPTPFLTQLDVLRLHGLYPKSSLTLLNCSSLKKGAHPTVVTDQTILVKLSPGKRRIGLQTLLPRFMIRKTTLAGSAWRGELPRPHRHYANCRIIIYVEVREVGTAEGASALVLPNPCPFLTCPCLLPGLRTARADRIADFNYGVRPLMTGDETQKPLLRDHLAISIAAFRVRGSNLLPLKSPRHTTPTATL